MCNNMQLFVVLLVVYTKEMVLDLLHENSAEYNGWHVAAHLNYLTHSQIHTDDFIAYVLTHHILVIIQHTLEQTMYLHRPAPFISPPTSQILLLPLHLLLLLIPQHHSLIQAKPPGTHTT